MLRCFTGEPPIVDEEDAQSGDDGTGEATYVCSNTPFRIYISRLTLSKHEQ